MHNRPKMTAEISIVRANVSFGAAQVSQSTSGSKQVVARGTTLSVAPAVAGWPISTCGTSQWMIPPSSCLRSKIRCAY
jgi:hypothetical protein